MRGRADALGATIDGVAGWTATKMNHIVMAFATLGAAVQAGGATYSATSFGTSLLTHALLMRRDAFCLIHRLFGWTRKLEGAPGFGRMSDAVAGEVQVLRMSAPVLGTDQRARAHPELLAANARGGSHPWVGVCRTARPATVARDLWRLRAKRGGARCLDDRVMLRCMREMVRDTGVEPALVEAALGSDDADDG